MTLQFTPEETEMLVRFLQERHRQLEHELWKTDHRSFKDQLRAEERQLESLLNKLGASVASAP